MILRRNEECFPSNQANDKNIMASFIANGYCGLQLASINMCRFFLQTIHLSTITTGDGKEYAKNHIIGFTIHVRHHYMNDQNKENLGGLIGLNGSAQSTLHF